MQTHKHTNFHIYFLWNFSAIKREDIFQRFLAIKFNLFYDLVWTNANSSHSFCARLNVIFIRKMSKLPIIFILISLNNCFPFTLLSFICHLIFTFIFYLMSISACKHLSAGKAGMMAKTNISLPFNFQFSNAFSSSKHYLFIICSFYNVS